MGSNVPAPAPRNATSPGAGSLRDLVIGFVVGSVGGFVANQTSSPELGDAAGQAAGQMSEVLIGAASAVSLALITFARKWAMDRLAQR